MPDLNHAVSLSRDAVIEAIAHLDAVESVLASLNGGVSSQLGGPFMAAATALHEAAFGERPGDDHGWATDPVDVETDARSDEIAADVLELVAERVPRYRSHARRIREQQSTHVGFYED
jgi:hypothetical protein